MVVAFATHADVAARWRPLTPAEELIADTLCDDASDIIRSKYPDIDTRIATGVPSAQSALRIVAAMVKRAMVVGDSAGLASQSQGAGPFSITQQYANPSANLYLNADEDALLSGDSGRPRAITAWLA